MISAHSVRPQKFMRTLSFVFAGILSAFSLSTQCGAFIGTSPRGPLTLNPPTRSSSISGKNTLSFISSRLSASKERTQEPKKMVTYDDLVKCQVRVLGYRVSNGNWLSSRVEIRRDSGRVCDGDRPLRLLEWWLRGG